jgi:hypothetical protein
MNKETLRMQFLSGVITESEYKQKLEESKKPINENFVGLGMVGNIFDREKTDYELAYEHYLGKLNENDEEDEIPRKSSKIPDDTYIGDDTWYEENDVEDDKIEEDQTLANINQLKQLATQVIDHYQELSKLSDEFAKINGYDTWREMGRDKGFTSYVNLFDQSVPNSQVNKLNDFISTGLKGDIEKYKADKSLELMRNKKQEKPFIPENQDLEEIALEKTPLDENTVGTTVDKILQTFEFSQKGNDEMIEFGEYLLSPEGPKNIAMTIKSRLKGEGGEKYFTSDPEKLQAFLSKLR